MSYTHCGCVYESMNSPTFRGVAVGAPVSASRASREPSDDRSGATLTCTTLRSRDGSARVEVLAVPQFEEHQLPETQRVIALAGTVLLDQPIDKRRLEVAALPGAR